jgi:DNA polymerase elongation subunit (family B)
MVSQTAVGWILDVSTESGSNNIIILIKLQEDGRVISFKEKLREYAFYILPKSNSAGEELIQQLSRYDQLIKRLYWDEKFVDLLDKNKIKLIGVSLANTYSEYRQDYKKLIQVLQHDSRVAALYNVELSELMQFIYAQLKIAPTSKVKIEYDQENLLSIMRIDDSKEIVPPLFSAVYIEVMSKGNDNDAKKLTKFVVKCENQTSIVFNGLSDPSFISYITTNNFDIIVFSGDRDLLSIQSAPFFTEWSRQKVIIYAHGLANDFYLLGLVEKARFSYLPLKLASKYGMIRLIDSRITYELLHRNYVIPTKKTVSKNHERLRTLEDIVDMDKAGMIISPEIGLHENVVVLDYDDEYTNLIINHNISFENNHSRTTECKHRSTNEDQMALLPTIMKDIVTRRIYLKQLLKKELEPDSLFYTYCQIRLETLKQILVCLYGTSGSIWNRFSNVQVFEEINKLSRQILLKTKDIVQSSGLELIYTDTDAVFLKKKDATKSDYEEMMNKLIRETGLDMTLEFHYKFLVLLYVEADDKMEARKHYYGITYNNQLITRGIDTRRHDSPAFIKQFQTTLLSKLFDYNSTEEVSTTGYENALLYITQSIDKIMNGEVQLTDLVISKLLRQNIEKYRSIFPHVAAAIRLNISGVIAGKGDNIKYVYTDSTHTDPLQRIVPAELISSENYDKEKYLEMLLDSAEEVLAIFGFNRSLYGFDNSKKRNRWWNELYEQHQKDIDTAKSEL